LINCKCTTCVFNNPIKEKCTNTDITIIPLTIEMDGQEVILGYSCAEGTEDFFAGIEDNIEH